MQCDFCNRSLTLEQRLMGARYCSQFHEDLAIGLTYPLGPPKEPLVINLSLEDGRAGRDKPRRYVPTAPPEENGDSPATRNFALVAVKAIAESLSSVRIPAVRVHVRVRTPRVRVVLRVKLPQAWAQASSENPCDAPSATPGLTEMAMAAGATIATTPESAAYESLAAFFRWLFPVLRWPARGRSARWFRSIL